MINSNLDPALTIKIVKIFLDLSSDSKGKKMLRNLYLIDGFIPATDQDHDSVREAFKIAGIDLKDSLKKRP